MRACMCYEKTSFFCQYINTRQVHIHLVHAWPAGSITFVIRTRYNLGYIVFGWGDGFTGGGGGGGGGHYML